MSRITIRGLPLDYQQEVTDKGIKIKVHIDLASYMLLANVEQIEGALDEVAYSLKEKLLPAMMSTVLMRVASNRAMGRPDDYLEEEIG